MTSCHIVITAEAMASEVVFCGCVSGTSTATSTPATTTESTSAGIVGFVLIAAAAPVD